MLTGVVACFFNEPVLVRELVDLMDETHTGEEPPEYPRRGRARRGIAGRDGRNELEGGGRRYPQQFRTPPLIVGIRRDGRDAHVGARARVQDTRRVRAPPSAGNALPEPTLRRQKTGRRARDRKAGRYTAIKTCSRTPGTMQRSPGPHCGHTNDTRPRCTPCTSPPGTRTAGPCSRAHTPSAAPG